MTDHLKPNPRHDPSPPAWWARTCRRACQPPGSPRVPLRVDGQPVGSVALPLAALLARAGLPVGLQDAALPGGAAALVLHGEPDTALRTLAAWLRAHGHAGRWRDELLPVRAAPEGPALAVVERGVVRNLGIPTWAVQLHAREPRSGRWWLQQRALDKATDPGRWDTLTGGLVAAGETVRQALERESREESGVEIARLAEAPIGAGRFTVRRPVDDSGSHGYLVETVFAFSCALAPGQLPSNQDGEVMAFAAFADDEIDTMVATGQLTLEAAVAIALCRGVRA